APRTRGDARRSLCASRLPAAARPPDRCRDFRTGVRGDRPDAAPAWRAGGDRQRSGTGPGRPRPRARLRPRHDRRARRGPRAPRHAAPRRLGSRSQAQGARPHRERPRHARKVAGRGAPDVPAPPVAARRTRARAVRGPPRPAYRYTQCRVTHSRAGPGGQGMNPQTIKVGGLTVNRMGFGAMRVCGPNIWGPPRDRGNAHKVLRRAVELGVNFFDTADSYGPHVDEELIAEALHPYPKGFVIATKGGLLRPRPGAWDPDGRPEHLKKALDGSLKRLKLERIDLYQLHAPASNV